MSSSGENAGKMIKILPEPTRRRLRSEYCVDSVLSCVEQLVYNSIESNARSVIVRLDLSFFNIQVTDDGQGIGQHDIHLAGDRYATSKHDEELNDWSGRGEALASIISMSSEVQIDSKTDNQCYSRRWKRGGAGVVSCSTAVETPRGTVVSVRNFLSTLPVRRCLVDSVVEVDRVRRTLEEMALIHPQVCFSLHDAVHDVWRLKTPRFTSSLEAFCSLFGSAHWRSQLKPIRGTAQPFAVDGFWLANEGHRNKCLQLIYLRRRRVNCVALQDVLSKCLNRVNNAPEDTFPIFFIQLQCPLKQLCILTHNSARICVEFQQFDTLVQLIHSTLGQFQTSRRSDVVENAEKTFKNELTLNETAFESLPCSLTVKRPNFGSLFQSEVKSPKTERVLLVSKRKHTSPLASFTKKFARKQRLTNAINQLAKYGRQNTADDNAIVPLKPPATECSVGQLIQSERLVAAVLPARPWTRGVSWEPSNHCSPLLIDGHGHHSTSTFQQCNLTKSHLQNIKVIGQVDARFITALSVGENSREILIFDQHAVHERILLETFTQDALIESRLESPLTVPLNPSQQTMALSRLSNFTRLGLNFQLQQGLLQATTVPLCFANKEESKMKLKQPSVLCKLIQDTVDDIVQSVLTSGTAGALLPKTINELLKSQACHAAIKFGEHLTLEKCDQLLNQLSKCNFPFQCAHGRPSVVPLVQLPKLHLIDE